MLATSVLLTKKRTLGDGLVYGFFLHPRACPMDRCRPQQYNYNLTQRVKGALHGEQVCGWSLELPAVFITTSRCVAEVTIALPQVLFP
jgi:hypothetical protein